MSASDNSNSNFSKHSLCTNCHEDEITYHRRRHYSLLPSHILALISRNETHLSFRNVRRGNATDVVFSNNKNIKINLKDQFL